MTRTFWMCLAATAITMQANAQTLDPGDADVESAQELLDLCAAEPETPEGVAAVIFCHGFMSGLMHFHADLTASEAFSPIACPGRRVGRDDLADEFVSWAGRVSNLTEISASSAVAQAAAARWPCS